MPLICKRQSWWCLHSFTHSLSLFISDHRQSTAWGRQCSRCRNIKMRHNHCLWGIYRDISNYYILMWCDTSNNTCMNNKSIHNIETCRWIRESEARVINFGKVGEGNNELCLGKLGKAFWRHYNRSSYWSNNDVKDGCRLKPTFRAILKYASKSKEPGKRCKEFYSAEYKFYWKMRYSSRGQRSWRDNSIYLTVWETPDSKKISFHLLKLELKTPIAFCEPGWHHLTDLFFFSFKRWKIENWIRESNIFSRLSFIQQIEHPLYDKQTMRPWDPEPNNHRTEIAF